MKILFLHGWQSTPGGVKPTYLKDHGHEVLNPALPDDDFDAAVRIAQAEFDRHQPDVVVGSSRGGAVAMNIDSGHDAAGPALPGMEAMGNGQYRRRWTKSCTSSTWPGVPPTSPRPPISAWRRRTAPIASSRGPGKIGSNPVSR